MNFFRSLLADLRERQILPAVVLLVVLAIGIRPNIDLARAAGLDVNRGVLVGDDMRTSDPSIYAVGSSLKQRRSTAGSHRAGDPHAATRRTSAGIGNRCHPGDTDSEVGGVQGHGAESVPHRLGTCEQCGFDELDAGKDDEHDLDDGDACRYDTAQVDRADQVEHSDHGPVEAQ